MNKSIKTVAMACYSIVLLFYVLFRGVVLNDYAFRFVEEDQALMWWGTVSILAEGIREPHFLGQAYGSMLESVVAIPFYLNGISLHKALPLATTLLAISPFLFIGALLVRKEKYLSSIACILLPLMMNWDFDVLTSIPRSFISGFALGIVGAVLLEQKRLINIYVGLLLCALAFVFTETTITVILLAVLWVLYQRICGTRGCLRRGEGVISLNYSVGVRVLVAVASVIVIVYFCNIGFYDINPHFNLHRTGAIQLSWDTFTKNLNHLPVLLMSFSAVAIASVPVCLILFFVCCFYVSWKRKNYEFLLMFVIALFGSFLFLFVDKTLDYRDEILFSQTRMFLFFPYVLLYIIWVGANSCHSLSLCSNSVAYRNKLFIFVLISLFFCVLKGLHFHYCVKELDELRYSKVLHVYPVDDVFLKADKIKKEAMINECEYVVFESDSRTLGYATSSLNFGLYVPYNVLYDRRTELWEGFLDHPVTGNVLFVRENNRELDFYVKKFEQGNLLDYLRIKTGLCRYPESHPLYIKFCSGT